MDSYKITELLQKKNDRLLYVNDFLNMYTFYVELLEEKEKEVGIEYPMLVYEMGDEKNIIEENSNPFLKEENNLDIFNEDLNNKNKEEYNDEYFDENNIF